MVTPTYYDPQKSFAAHARIGDMQTYHALMKKAHENYEEFWGDFAREKITWMRPFTQVLDSSKAPFFKWFNGGMLNVSVQCIDRHLPEKAQKNAIVFVAEDGTQEHITYGELSKRVNQTANLLKNQFGITKGDRVVLYMPMIPDAAVMMLAIARLGAIHSVVFGGYSYEAVRERISDSQAKLVITADGAFRRGKPYLLKPTVDKALENGCESIKKVLVVARNGENINRVEERDYYYHELIASESDVCPPQELESEDTLFLLYTSGSTGKPKGIVHTQAGYILWAQMTMEWVFDIHDADIYWCTADVGWITGHTYIVYGPLACGATTVMYEGVFNYPDASRWWRIIEELKVTKFYTAPTAIRALKKLGAQAPLNYDLSSLKVLGSVGEPINPDAWKWYYEVVGGKQCSIVDTWWQTETGGQVISPLPGATPMVAGSATLPLPGMMVAVLNEEGQEVKAGEKGLVCITKPWPSMLRNVWGDSARYEKSYFGDFSKEGRTIYFSGDGAIVDEAGYITITGRTDDVIKVSGHRIGSAEVESCISSTPFVAEVAVVGEPHPIKGESLCAFVVTHANTTLEKEVMSKQINQMIKDSMGAIVSCDRFVFVPGLPKTRSGKVMRRILRTLSQKQPITQDISTLEDPAIVGVIASQLQ